MSQPVEPPTADSIASVSLKDYDISGSVPADFAPSVSLKDYDISGSVPEAIDSESVETLPYDESETHDDAKNDFYNINKFLLAGSIILIGLAACFSTFGPSNATGSSYIMQHHYN